ncbi:MAG TPA: phosphoribosylanthranilate isomerase [Bryobacteraceae bacterium]|nr:phosphoribosylanthranilate isomerase [Bryobacteraceae bacterium]
MMVKICGITNREDALAAVEAGASAIGFNFYRESPRYISHTGAAMIGEKIPANVWKVGVFVNESAETIAKTVIEAGLDVAQLHGTSEARGVRTWRAIPAGKQFRRQISNEVEAVLIDTPSDVFGGSGETWDWATLPNLTQKVIVAGGLDADNVRTAIEQAHPWGVDACSRIEKAPGIKDHEKMCKFIQAALAS